MATGLRDILTACADLLPESFRAKHARLFEAEHLDRLASRLLAQHREGVPGGRLPPHFDAECTPPLADAFAPFAAALALWDAAGDRQTPAIVGAFAEAILRAGCGSLLLLLGQRRTPASLTDARALPPPRLVLLAAAARPCGPRDPLSAAARALAKHVHRSPAPFWGASRGSVADKNRAAATLLADLIDRATWWNVFGHYQHDIVYEARVPTGHGARWGQDGREFIGFLEPFEQGRRRESDPPPP
jgi:hypothetical protein